MKVEEIADAHCHKTLLKSKTISESGLLPDYVVQPKRKEGMSPEEILAADNVTARLYNTKGVKENIAHLMAGVYAVTGIPNPANRQQKQVKAHNAEKTEKDEKPAKKAKVEKEERSAKKAKADEKPVIEEEEVKRKAVKEGVEVAWDGFDSGSEDEEDVGSDGEPVDFNKFEGRLGGSSDEDSESEFEIPAQHQKVVPAKKIISRGLSVSVSGSDGEDHDVDMEEFNLSSGSEREDSDGDNSQEGSNDDEESESDAAIERASPPPKAKKDKVIREPSKPLKAGSQFLPTLMGGYWSGEEEASDIEEELKPIVRKNRPGQQARRAIWEKKYGSAANHVKNAPAESRDDGWDAKRGAKGADDRDKGGSGRGGRTPGAFGRGGGGGGVPGAFGRAGKVTGENASELGSRGRGRGKQDDVGVLHPSWQAAKKAKDEKKSAKFEGKKVVFD